MKYAVLILGLLAVPALAAEPSPKPPLVPMDQGSKPPELVYEPTTTIARIIQFFGDPKIAADVPLYQSDVLPLLKQLQGCAAMQLPNGKGECPGYHVK